MYLCLCVRICLHTYMLIYIYTILWALPPAAGPSLKCSMLSTVSSELSGGTLGHLGVILGYLGGIMWPPWGHCASSWSHLGPSWDHLGPSWWLWWPFWLPFRGPGDHPSCKLKLPAALPQMLGMLDLIHTVGGAAFDFVFFGPHKHEHVCGPGVHEPKGWCTDRP